MDTRRARPETPYPPPAVSVLMSAHNAEPYLRDAITSLLAQTVPNFELVVIDDASSDDSPRTLLELAEQDPRIHIHTNQERRGLATSLNDGMELCRAPLIARADADDLYHPSRLEKQLAFMRDNPDYGVVSCGNHRIDESGTLLRTDAPLQGDSFIRFRMNLMNCLLHPGVVFRKQIVQDAGGYNPSYWTAQDSELWSRLRLDTRMENLAEPLVSYRVHGKSIVRSRGADGRKLSLSVPQRNLSSYLGRPVTLDATDAAVSLFQKSRRLSRTENVAAESLLWGLQAAARPQEPLPVLRQFVSDVHRGLLNQADRALKTDAATARRCAWRSIRWRRCPASFRALARTLLKRQDPATKTPAVRPVN